MTPTDNRRSPDTRARVSAANKAHARTPEGKAQAARRGAASQTPEARAKRAATIARKKALLEAGTIEDKMNEFIPGIADGQQEFYEVGDDGMVVRWWIVPNTFGPSSYSLADDHPLGNSPLPGWYDSDGKALSRNPRTVRLHPREAAQ